MYTIQAEASFDAAHFLKGYDGKCSNLHGHHWQVFAEIYGTALRTDTVQAGMLTDFGILKRDLRALADELDHALLVTEGSLRPETAAALTAENFRMVTLPFRTTAENFSRYFYDKLTAKGYAVNKVTVYETPENCAGYSGEEGSRIAVL